MLLLATRLARACMTLSLQALVINCVELVVQLAVVLSMCPDRIKGITEPQAAFDLVGAAVAEFSSRMTTDGVVPHGPLKSART